MPEEEDVQSKFRVRTIVTPEPRWLETVAAALVVGVIGAGIALATALLERANAPRQESIQSRIAVLSRSLEDAASIIADIEREIDSRTDLVSQLEQRARVAERLQETNREEVEAISLLLREELGRNETWNFWSSFGQNLFFMLAGAFVGHFVERWMSRRPAPKGGPEPA